MSMIPSDFEMIQNRPEAVDPQRMIKHIIMFFLIHCGCFYCRLGCDCLRDTFCKECLCCDYTDINANIKVIYHCVAWPGMQITSGFNFQITGFSPLSVCYREEKQVFR